MRKQWRHVYIIDDDISFGRSLKRLLQSSDIAADCFVSAEEFLSYTNLDLDNGFAIIDFNMPGCNGFALMDRMHALGWKMPAIIISGQANVVSADEALKRGAKGFMHKPLDEKMLLDLIEF